MVSSTVSNAPQHLRALNRANQVRLARAELKRRISAGHTKASEIVLDNPWEAESMKLADLLMSQKRWGRTRCRKFLLPLSISESKPIGQLTQRQRMAIASTLMRPGSSVRRDLATPVERFHDHRLAAV